LHFPRAHNVLHRFAEDLRKYDACKQLDPKHLLGKAIESIITVKETSDIDSLFAPGGTSALTAKIRGLDDFELIDFVVIRGKCGNRREMGNYGH
jgi:hypothetical protein